MKYTNLMSVLSNVCKNKIPIKVFFENGIVIKSYSNIGVYETDNGLECDAEGYLEYYACSIKVSKIVQNQDDLEIGEYIELSEYNEPRRIEFENGEILWEKSNDKN
ncbi:MAG: hypothetical protein IKW59_05415 [Clostridia bacterium]|nr:hypothetical protein [Clostridia bacterium]